MLLGAAAAWCVCLRGSRRVTIVVAGLLRRADRTAARRSSRAVTAASVYLSGRMLDHRGPAAECACSRRQLPSWRFRRVAVFDGGFILSFGATLGILLGAARLVAWLVAETQLAQRAAHRQRHRDCDRVPSGRHGLGGSCADTRECGCVLADHICRTGPELRRHSADGGRAGRCDGHTRGGIIAPAVGWTAGYVTHIGALLVDQVRRRSSTWLRGWRVT